MIITSKFSLNSWAAFSFFSSATTASRTHSSDFTDMLRRFINCRIIIIIIIICIYCIQTCILQTIIFTKMFTQKEQTIQFQQRQNRGKSLSLLLTAWCGVSNQRNIGFKCIKLSRWILWTHRHHARARRQWPCSTHSHYIN